jgi:Xaa-Pro aminopeptidase
LRARSQLKSDFGNHRGKKSHMSHCRFATLLIAVIVALAIGDMAAQESSPAQAAVYRARREQAMHAAPDSILLVRARPSVMTEYEEAFRQVPAFYYLTGLGNAVGALLALDGRKHEAWLFVPDSGRLPGFGAAMHAPYAYVVPGAETATRLGLEHVVLWTEFAAFLDRRLAEDATLTIRGPFRDVAASAAPAALVGQNETALWEATLRSRWPQARFGPAPDANRLREIKDSEEITTLRAVARSSGAALTAGLSALRPGLRQRTAEAEVFAACIRAGADGISFWPWLMSGANSDLAVALQSLADYRFLDRVMRSGDLVRVDVGCTQEHYEGDVGRTAPVSGRFLPEQREAWDLFVAAYRAALATMKPGRTKEDVFAAWQGEFERRRSTLKTALGRRTGEVALSPNAAKSWQIHGVGVASAEGTINTLRTGQVFAFEPILTVDGLGLYLEDMILVTPTGTEVLTTGLPYTATEIERAMRSGRQTSGGLPRR